MDGGREILRGALEGAFEGLGRDRIEAQGLSVIVLKVIDTPEPGDQSPNPLEWARVIAKYLVQSVVSQRK
jgi:hypothetical protein